MSSIGGWRGAIAIVVTIAIHPQESRADVFTGREFASWAVASQDSYIETSVTMAGVVLTQVKPQAATCVNDWYFKDRVWERRNPEIRKQIVAHAESHPSGVILAVIFQACGALR